MKIEISPKEIAELVSLLQERLDEKKKNKMAAEEMANLLINKHFTISEK